MAIRDRFEIEVTTSEDGAQPVVFVRGDVDVATAHEIGSAVRVVAGWPATARTVVDISDDPHLRAATLDG